MQSCKRLADHLGFSSDRTNKWPGALSQQGPKRGNQRSMASNYTENYKLPLWEGGDSFVREEFNAANKTIDAALGELRYFKLAELTTTEELTQIDFDVSSIDFTKYDKIELFFTGYTESNYVYLRVNNLSDSTSYKVHSQAGEKSPSDGTAAQMLAWKGASRDMNSSVIQFNRPTAGGNIGAWILNMSCYTGSSQSAFQFGAPYDLAWDDLNSFNFTREYAKTFPVGVNVALYGLKR